MKNLVNKGNQYLSDYLYSKGDSDEILLQKKIWWILTIVGLPFLVGMSLIISDKKGSEVAIINVIFGLALIGALLLFHFQKNHIERYSLFIQVTIVSLITIKVYYMGGLLQAGGAIFIGLISPLYALTTPNRKRAVFLFLVYLIGMIAVTELQPDRVHNYFQYYYYMGFSLGISMAFSGLYYYTGQLVKLKQEEKSRLEELDHMKNSFYTHITHELRTPLTIILGMAAEMRENPDKNLDYGVEMIERNGMKLLKMTNQLLDLSKMDAMLMPVQWIQNDIIGYLKYLVESFQSFAQTRNIDLSYIIQENSLMMDFDPEKISDILTNLISNAIKFTHEGGKVKVKVFKEVRNDGEWLQILVVDNGQGIAKKHLPKVFERYFQAGHHQNEYTEGSGLGLAITRELICLMKGSISVSSRLNKGTIFRVTMPITNMAEKSVLLEYSNPKSEKSQVHKHRFMSLPVENNDKLKLLIVEDSKDVAIYLETLLAERYELIHGCNGTEGLQLAIDIVPDLIISDVMMPVMDGFSMCRKLKNDIRTSHIPIILLTARAETSSKMEGLQIGVDAYLSKPFSKKELYIRIKKLIAQRKELRESFQRMAQVSGELYSKAEIISDTKILTHEREFGFLAQVRKIFEAHLSEEEFGITELCANLGMSRSQVYRKFSALTDISVYQFIRKLRLAKAKQLLRSTNLNVAEVAYDSGFKNPSHFSRVYNEQFGIPPSKEQRKILV